MKRILSYITAVLLLISTTAGAVSYSDMTKDYGWAKDAVENLSEKAYFSGYPDGTFRPEKSITRGELGKLMVEIFGAKDPSQYSDVSSEAWYAKYLSQVGGYFLAEDRFFPDQYATREEVAYAVFVGMKLPAPTSDTSGFSDEKDIRPEYRDAVQSMAEFSILNGYHDGTFRPDSSITRTETAVILHRCLSIKEATDDSYEAPLEEENEETEEETVSQVKSINRFFIVDKISQVINENDEVVTKVVGYQDGEKQELLLNDVEIYNGNQISSTGLRPHDIIFFNRDLFGNIRTVSIALRPSKMPEISFMEMFYYGQSTSRKILAGYVTRIYREKGIELVSLNKTTEGSYSLDPNVHVYLLNKNGKIELSELSEIMYSEYETGDKIVAYCYENVISEILIIKE